MVFILHVLITGGSGFLGSHLCDRFLKDGHSVIAMDNFITGNPRNVAHLTGRDDFLLVEHDVSNYINLDGDIDAVLHFASPASPIDYLNLPIQTLKVGALGTHNALGVAKAKNARFLLASTSEIYGDPLEHPQKESYWGHVNPIGPRGVYDEAKRFAEAITMAYHRTHNVDTRIVRIFNTYGPRMRDDGRVVPNFMVQAVRGDPLTVYGDGQQTRSFCYVSDLVEGIYRLLMADYSEDISGPVNLGNPGYELSMTLLAETVGQLSGDKSEVIYVNKRIEDDPQTRRPDITRARQVLNWEPVVSLEDGLKSTLEYFRSVT